MRSFRISSALVLTVLAAGAAFAASGGSPPPTTPPPSSPSTPSASGARPSTPRQEAELSYALAYEEIAKAKKDVENGKAKNAEKKLKRALERAERAVALDAAYHEAWNLAGYAARKLGDYDKAFAAYEKCLSLKPDYAPAREYLGEAWLEKGELKKARGQLVLLEKLSAGSAEANALRAAIGAWEAAHPAEVKPDSTVTPVDSAGAASGR